MYQAAKVHKKTARKLKKKSSEKPIVREKIRIFATF